MKDTRDSKLELIRGLMTGRRSTNEINGPEFVVLFPAFPTPECVRAGAVPPHGAKYVDMMTGEYLTGTDLDAMCTKYPGLKCILIRYDTD